MKKIALFCGALIVSVMTLNAEVVYNGEAHNVGSWNAKQLPVADYAVLATAKAGDALVINVTAVEDGARITLQSKDWKGWTDKYDVTVGRHVFVLTKATADSVRNGLIVTGEKYTFDKVELLYPQNLWTGTLGDGSDWAQGDQLEPTLFSGLTEGDLLSFSVTDLIEGQDWHSYALRLNWETNICEGWISTAGTYVHTLTEEDVTALSSATAIVPLARYLTLTDINTYVDTRSDGPATAIENIQGDKINSTKVLRNGQLLILRGEKVYTVNGAEIR